MAREYPVFRISAVQHKDVASNCKVFSLQEFEYYLYVDTPVYIAKEYELYQVDEIVNDAEFLCIRDLYDHEPGRKWYRFKSAMMNKETGYHTYRLSFVNTRTDDTCLLYIAYVVQNNHPTKEYMYMDEDERTCNCG